MGDGIVRRQTDRRQAREKIREGAERKSHSSLDFHPAWKPQELIGARELEMDSEDCDHARDYGDTPKGTERWRN